MEIRLHTILVSAFGFLHCVLDAAGLYLLPVHVIDSEVIILGSGMGIHSFLDKSVDPQFLVVECQRLRNIFIPLFGLVTLIKVAFIKALLKSLAAMRAAFIQTITEHM